MRRFTVIVGWCLATGSALVVIYCLYDHHTDGTTLSMVASGFYVSYNRTVWSLSLSWQVVACASGQRGPVNFVLSWKLWTPLGRLTFAAYLIHPLIIYAYQLPLMIPIHFTDITLIYMFVSHFIFSYLFEYIVSTVVEAPIMCLEKLLRPEVKVPKTKQVYKEPSVCTTT